MKKLILFLIAILAFANESEIQQKLKKEIEAILDNNTTAKIEENNFSEKNVSKENYLNSKEKTPPKIIETFEDNFYTQNTKTSFAIVIDKKKFFKFLPSIINSLNAYLIEKGVDFNISVYDNDVNISSLPQQYIIDIETNKSKITALKDYNKTFFIPTFNKNDFNTSFKNIYFGGLDFKAHIDKFNNFINDRLFSVSQKNQLSFKLLKYEKENPFFVKNFFFPHINYRLLNNSYLILNTNLPKSAQVLSTITANEINMFLIFSPQFCYSRGLIFLTQKEDRKKLIISNSIINPPLKINDYATLLNSNIRFNWLNYATDILANKIYNMQNDEDLFYMNDFYIYIFENQINYKVKLYRVENNSFKEVK